MIRYPIASGTHLSPFKGEENKERGMRKTWVLQRKQKLYEAAAATCKAKTSFGERCSGVGVPEFKRALTEGRSNRGGGKKNQIRCPLKAQQRSYFAKRTRCIGERKKGKGK